MNLKTKDLRAAMARVTPILKSRSTLPILYCVKLHALKGRLFATASNLDECASVAFDGCDTDDLADTCVFGQRLNAALQFAPEEHTTLEPNGNGLIVSSGKREWKLATMPAKEFPDPPQDAFKRIGVNCADIATCIEKVMWAADTDPNVIPYAKHLLHIRLTPKSMMVEAASSSGLARCEKAVISASADVTVPVSFADGLVSALREEGAVLSVGDRFIRIEHDGGSYTCKLAEAKYPSADIDRIIAAPTEPVGKLWPAVMAEALASSGALESGVKGAFDRTYVNFGPSGAAIEFRTTDNHAGNAEVPGKFVALRAEINLRYWLAALKQFDGEVPLAHASNYFVLSNGELTVILMKFAERP